MQRILRVYYFRFYTPTWFRTTERLRWRPVSVWRAFWLIKRLRTAKSSLQSQRACLFLTQLSGNRLPDNGTLEREGVAKQGR